MKTLLKMLFKEMMFKQDAVRHINTIADLRRAVIAQEKLIELFAMLNDEADFSTEEILYIAELAYRRCVKLAEPAEVLTEFVTYDIEDARKDAAQLHKLNRKATLATAMIDQEIAELQKDLKALEARKNEILDPLNKEMQFLKDNLTAFHQRELEAGGDKTIKLPWATLKSKTQVQDYERDDALLLEWVRVQCSGIRESSRAYSGLG